MELNLQNCGLDRGAVDQIPHQRNSEVGNTDISDKSFLDQLLHCSPGVNDGNVIFDHKFVGDPSRRVSCFGIDIFEAHRKMNEIQVKVFET